MVETTTRAFPGLFFILAALFYTVRILWLGGGSDGRR